MREFTRIWALILCVSALLLLGGCNEPPVELTTTPTTAATEPPLSAEESYLLGRESIDRGANWILNYTTEEKRTIGEDTYTENVSGTASFSKLGQADMTAVVEEQLSYGSYNCAYSEVYCEGAAYAQVNGSSFTQAMEPQTFADRQIPAVLLDSSLYQTITRTVMEDTTVISFSDATGVEAWLNAGKAKLVSASGTATLDSTGVLRETAYQVEYTLGETTYLFSAAVRVTVPHTLDLGATHQEHIKGSVALEDLRVPKMLLQVVGDIYTSGQMYCEAVESIYSEAIPLTYSQDSVYHLTGAEETLSARAEYLVSLSDYRGEATSETWVESFADGKFTTSQKNAQIIAMTAEQMRQYFEDAFLSALVAPIYLENAAVQEKGNIYRLEMTGNDDFVADMMRNIGAFLKVDLDEQATESRTVSAGGYLTIDRETGLPVTMGLSLEREHTIDSVVYQLTYQLDHKLTLSGD